MKKFFVAIICAATIIFNTASAAPHDRETLYQVALLQAFAMGYFDGSVTVKDLKTHGDTGIGSFDKLNGDMIFLDGVVYRANPNCEINVVNDKTTLTFGDVTFFDEDAGGVFYDEYPTKNLLEKSLNEFLVNENMSNRFYMIKLHGDFNEILLCAAREQSKPYPPLSEVMKSQNEVTFKNISGTIVGLYCPEFMRSLNNVGWHLHFISDDKKIGGHVLELNLKSGSMFHLDKTDAFRMDLPTKENFHALNFKKNVNEEIRTAQQNSRR